MHCKRLLKAGMISVIGMGLLVVLGAQATPVPQHPYHDPNAYTDNGQAGHGLTGLASDQGTVADGHDDTDDTYTLPVTRWRKIKVQSGDSLSGLFAQTGLRSRQWAKVLDLGPQVKPLKTVNPGDILEIRKTPDNRLAELRYSLGPVDTLSITRDKTGLQANVVQLDSYTRRLSARGRVRKSLSKSLARADVPTTIANQLADIYRHRANLSRNMTPGDRFSIIYDAQFSGGKQVAAGPIVAASITTDGEDLKAFRALDADGRASYYDSDGKSFKPAFSRRPVNYTHISSPFDSDRIHPILHIRKPHNGVDMAATRGTAIHAAANGTIKFIGRMAGYGRLIELNNYDGYSTRYGHMFRFADDLEKGDQVEAGQVIGYVGSSGEATGSHLHFEIRKDGVPHDPLVMALPNGDPLPEDRLPVFSNRIQPLIAWLDDVPGMPRTLIASNAGLEQNSNCTRAGIVNAALALAPASALDNHSLNDLFCMMAVNSNT